MAAVSDANRALAFLKNPGRVATVMRLSRHATRRQRFLAEYARRHNAAVTVIPTVVDTTQVRARGPIAGTARRAGRRLDWQPDDVPLSAERSPTCCAKSASAARLHAPRQRRRRPVDIPGVRVEEAPWSLADEVRLFNTSTSASIR